MENHNTDKININVYAAEASALHQLRAELFDMGLQLHFPTESSAFDNSDIAIIDVSKIDDHADITQNPNLPFLLSGVHNLGHDLPDDLIKDSVGFINGHPSPTDVCIAARLGLLLHHQRQRYSSRLHNFDNKINNNRTTGIAIGLLMVAFNLTEQHILDCLKSVCRTKQRRIPDVANEVIELYKQSKLRVHNNSTEKQLKIWLDSTIACKSKI
ncbi:MAG: hypothetical protein IBX57_02875 [Gammaproteobacteria bacterium]|nr:hypothetical protein [Gammaproteobacteria bacterium]